MSYTGHLFQHAFIFDDAPKIPARLAASAPADTANRWVRVIRLQDAAGAIVPVTEELMAGAELPNGTVATVATVTWKGGPRADDQLLAAAEELAPGKSLTVVKTGKNLGKKNATTALTQALKEAESARTLRLRKAGTMVADEAGPSAAPVAPSQPRPMLLNVEGATKKNTLTAQRLADEKWFWQEKLDGVRSVAHLSTEASAENSPGAPGESVQFYSRTGKARSVAPRLVAGSAALLAALVAVADCAEHPLTNIDGELYRPDWPLNRINGAASKGADGPDANGLEFHVYDAFRVNPETLEVEQQPFEQRMGQLVNAFVRAAEDSPEFADSGLKLVATHEIESREQLDDELRRVRGEGGEGLVVRAARGPYVRSDGDRRGDSSLHSDNKNRPDTTLKMKPFKDGEFPLVGYTAGKARNSRMVTWVMEAKFQPDPKEEPLFNRFTADPMGITNKQREQLFDALEADPGLFEREFAGQLMTVQYATISNKTGKPTQPKVRGIRPPEDDPDWEDPVAKILGQ